MLRDTLYGDLPPDQWPTLNSGDPSPDFPWSVFISAREHLAAGRVEQAVALWQEIAQSSGLEPRHYLQAWHYLRQYGQTPPDAIATKVLGVVVEVAMPEGLDLLAAYADHSARYYNFSGRGVVWEHADDSLDALINELLEAGQQVVDRIGPWEGDRPGPPPRDNARLSFLTARGLHFGQAPMEVLSSDPMGGRVLHLASALMGALIAKTQ